MSVAPVITTPPSVDESVDDGRGDTGEDWWCIRTDPFHCPGEGCSFVASFMTAGHLVVVWPRGDDPAILGAAANAREVGRHPQVVLYRSEFGASITWDEWVHGGQKVHGRLDRPDGWEERSWRM